MSSSYSIALVIEGSFMVLYIFYDFFPISVKNAIRTGCDNTGL